MNIITYCNNPSKLFYLKETEKNFDSKITYIVEEGEWKGNITKIVRLVDIISKYNNDDIFIFIDAFDVLINSNYDEIIEKFKSYNCDILVGTELNCYPGGFKKKFDKITPNDSKSKYPNSGGYMGYVKQLKHLLNWINENRHREKSDQACFFKYYISNHEKVNIKLDTQSKIFLNMHLISWKEVDFRKGRLYNNVLENNPCFIHFNGGTWQTHDKKNIMPIFVEKLNLSKNDPEDTIYNLNEYKQIITKSCYPHPQI